MQDRFCRRLLLVFIGTGLSWTSAAIAAPADFDIPPLKLIGPQAGRVTLQAQFLTSIMPELTEGRGFGLSAHYGVTERLKLGLQAAYLASSETDALEGIRAQGIDPAAPAFGAPLGGLFQLHWMAAAEAQFTPISSQLHLTDNAALNFEFYVPLGVGVAHLRRRQAEFSAEEAGLVTTGYDVAYRPILNLGVGARAYITPSFALSAELRDYFFLEPSAGQSGVNARPHLQVGLQFSFGSDSSLPDPLAPKAMPSFLVQRVEFSAQLSASFYDRFINSIGLSGAIGYHLLEHWALEVFGAKFFTNPTEHSRNTFQLFSLRSAIVEQVELLWATGATVQFIPMSGRMNVLGHTMAVSPYIGVGVGVGAVRVLCDAGMRLDPDTFGDDARCPLIPPDADANAVVYEPNRLRPLGIISGGLRLRLADHFALRLEVKDHIYTVRIFRPDINQNDQLASGIRHNVMSQVGLSILLGGS